MILVPAARPCRLRKGLVIEMDDFERPAWMDDDLVKSIDPKKLDFLSRLFTEGREHGRNQKEMIAYVMPMMRKAKLEHLSFTPQELNAAISAIRKYSTQEELKQIDKILAQNNVKGQK